jgi:hypothetical protein
MKKKFILISMLLTFAAYFINAQVIFDPATVDTSKLAPGFDVVVINDTSYLQVVLNEWSSWTYIPQVDIGADVTSFTFKAKYVEGTSGYTFDQVNTFFKFSDPDWVELTANGAASDTAFKEYTQSMSTPGIAAVLQVAGQETITWNAVSGDTIYIGVVTAVDGTVTEVDQSDIDGTSMENGFAWSIANYGGDDAVEDNAYYTFNYTDDTPTAGSGGCVRIQAINPGTGTQMINSLLYKKIKVMGGVTYSVSGAFKDITPDKSVSNFWCEAGISPTDPTVVDSIHYIMGINTWEGCGEGLDGTFEDDYCKYDGSYKVPGDGELDYYLVLLTGNWNNTLDTFDVLVDELKTEIVLTDLITGGNMEDSLAWITYWRSDNADTGSFTFNYTDDLPTAGQGGCLNITTDPITNSWVELICTRKEPIEDQEFNASDSYVIYERNTWMVAPYNNMDVDGTFEDDFNYRSPSFAAPYSRNFVISDTVTQTEWFVLIKAGSSNGNGVLTPDINYLFDEISLTDLGVDTEAPTAPANLAADEAGTTITWDASTDNIGVFKYKISDGATDVATTNAKATGNTYTFTDLTEGAHTLGVVATDQSGNESGKSTVDVNIVLSVENNEAEYFTVYPNPSEGIVNITTESNSLTTLEVYTITGKLIASYGFNSKFVLDMRTAGAGLYILYLKSEGHVDISRLIIE